MGLDDLSPAHCILLAVTFASSSSVESLHRLTPSRPDVFTPELVFRILLTFLPETLDPAEYLTYIREVGTRIYLEQRSSSEIDISSVSDISDAEATARLRKLHLKPLADSPELDNAVQDPLTLFLIHRARIIDTETGLLLLVPQLVGPFFDRNNYIRDWFIANVLTLLRLDYEYHPNNESPTPLSTFEELTGEHGVAFIMSKVLEGQPPGSAPGSKILGRDFRGVIGPWTYGNNSRKRRKLGYTPRAEPVERALRNQLEVKGSETFSCNINSCGKRYKSEALWRQHVEKLHGYFLEQLDNDPSIQPTLPELHYSEEEAVQETADWVNDWRSTFKWMINTAVHSFPIVVNIMEEWDGPRDVDFGIYGDSSSYQRVDPDVDRDLLRRYCQTAFAAIYVVEKDDETTIDGAHAILVRLADLMGFEPPPDLATSIDLLPKIERHSQSLETLPRDLLQYQALLLPGQPLTTPKVETFSLLQMFVYSSYQLLGIGQPMSVAKVAKLRFWSDASEQLEVMKNILQAFARQRKDELQWDGLRRALIWLWGWGLEESPENAKEGYGVLGRIDRDVFEKEILIALCRSSQSSLAIKTYISTIESNPPLALVDAESTIIDGVLEHYDQASNGNKTRGGVKRALDMLNGLRPFLPQSPRLNRIAALIDATHALSFYSLTLQPNTPLKPAEIRTITDPLTLVDKVFHQNPGSYTKLDDLIQIGEKLVFAASSSSSSSSSPFDSSTTISRRITGMAIEAALREDDFETAYSYVVNRLTSTPDASDDIAWRAAYHAGKHRTTAAATSTAHASPQARRLEQRMDLLSQSLTLAPPHALPEILTAWRRCEEELLSVLAADTAEETAFDDGADRGSAIIPGGFSTVREPAFAVQPRRKELGRGATEEAPMGLFDVARGAAAALGRNATALSRSGTPASAAQTATPSQQQTGERVRKRDMVASAVTGGLASGIGWVIGARPVNKEETGSEW